MSGYFNKSNINVECSVRIVTKHVEALQGVERRNVYYLYGMETTTF